MEGAGRAQRGEGQEAPDADPDGQLAGDVEAAPREVGEGQGEGEDEEGAVQRLGEAGVQGGDVVCRFEVGEGGWWVDDGAA